MKDLLKLFVCWVAFGFAVLLTGLVCGAQQLRSMSIPGSAPAAQQLAAQLCGGALLVLGLSPLARRLAGSFAGLLALLFRTPEPLAKLTPAITRAAQTNQRSAAS
jgi:hypothetical protein